MRKNNKQNPFPLRKYYGVNDHRYSHSFLESWRTTVQHSARGEIRQNRKSAWKKNRLELITALHTRPHKQQRRQQRKHKKETETTSAQMKRTMSESVTYNGTSKLTWPIKGNIILPYSVNSTIYFESLDQYRINKGILIEAKEGDEVKAVT